MAPAATDERARDAREAELCDRASSTDWLYLGGALAADVASIVVDDVLKNSTSTGMHYVGPAAFGLSWGFTLGGGYLALPKCSKDWVGEPPPEGSPRADWPLAIAFAGLAGLMAPLIVQTENGPAFVEWPVGERAGRMAIASGTAVVGALLPYLLPPKTWRAAKELEHLRAAPTDDARGAFVSWAVRF